MTGKEIKIAIIDNSIDSSVYQPVKHWSAYLTAPWRSYKAPEGRFPALKDGLTHIILTGSEASIVERAPWVYEEIAFVQKAVDRGLSILGSCYGHQLIALALKGPSHVRRCAQPEIGWIPIEITKSNELLGEKKTVDTFSIHFDEVVDLDDSFLVYAASRECRIQGFQLKERPVWGIQFHPEIDIPSARELLINLVKLKLPTRPLFERALRDQPRDSGLIRSIVGNFIKRL